MQPAQNRATDARFWSCFQHRILVLGRNAEPSELPENWWTWPLLKRADELLGRVLKSGLPDHFHENKVSGIAICALMACEAAPKDFKSALQRQLSSMRSLVEAKGADYNAGGVSILEYWPQGIANIFHEIRKRSLRLVSVARSGQEPRFDEATDICLDIAAYSLFLTAYMDAEISFLDCRTN